MRYLLIICLALAGCDDDSSSEDVRAFGGGDDAGTMGEGGGGGDVDAAPEAEPDAAVEPDAAPEPVTTPELPAYSGEDCPEITAGSNTIDVAGTERRFEVFLPAEPEGAPLLFIWHGLGDNANNMARAFGAAGIADQFGAVVVVPWSSGQARASEWSMIGATRIDEQFFTDMLTCVEENFDVDNRRIYTTGFSAGALWSSFLLTRHAQFFAAVVTFSGGTSNTLVRYRTPENTIPVLAIHGGPNDTFGGGFLNFRDMTEEMVAGLLEDGHFVVSCDHGRGHTIPFLPSAFALPFLFDHQLGDATSPYAEGLDERWPDFCAIAE